MMVGDEGVVIEEDGMVLCKIWVGDLCQGS